MDRREDDARQARHAAAALVDGTGEVPNQPEITMEDVGGDDAEETEEDEDLDDMFAIDTSKPKKKKPSTSKVTFGTVLSYFHVLTPTCPTEEGVYDNPGPSRLDHCGHRC